MNIDPSSVKVCLLMMVLGATTFCLVLMSVFIVVYQWWMGLFIWNSFYIYVGAVAVTLTTYILNKYFEAKIHEKTLPK